MKENKGIDIIVCLAFYAIGISGSVEIDVRILYWRFEDIVMIDVNTGRNSSIASIPIGNHIDYHDKYQYIYWLDSQSGERFCRITYQSEETKDFKVLMHNIDGNMYIPYDFVVDSVNDLLFWTDHSMHTLMRSELDGSNMVVAFDNLTYGDLLAIDPINRFFYFRNWSNNKVVRWKEDGSFEEEIFDEPTLYDIAIDLEENRLYVSLFNEIRSTSLNGGDGKIIFSSNDSYIFHIEISDAYVYFFLDGKLYRIGKSGSNLTFMNYFDYEYFWNDFKVYRVKNECNKYKEIQSEEKRSTGYILESTDYASISDDHLEENFYRVISRNGDKMPSFPPGVMHCGTVNPIWLNGTLPEKKDGNVTRVACVQSASGICVETIEIEIRNCNEYYIYYLKNTTLNSAYCFGSGPVLCPDGQLSETGSYPGCTTSFPKDTTTVSVEAKLIEGASYPIPGLITSPSLVPVFQCMFNDVSNGTYVYDVYWYINGNHVINKTNIKFKSINSTALRHIDWINTYTMNMEVQCAIRMRYSINSTPSNLIFSMKFQAGLFPDRYEYTVIEGESIKIGFTSTVPVGCISSQSDFRKKQCYQNFYVFQPEHRKAVCSNNIVKRDIVFNAHFCGLQIGSSNWTEKATLQVFGFSDGVYNSHDRSTYIRISSPTVTTPNEMWQNVKVSDIKITVIDKDSLVTNRICQSYNDPHITTFDGRIYHYMQIGEFVIYRNAKGPYWIHILLTNCGFGWVGSACHCGIAIRSRNSLFVLRTCQTVSRTEKHLLQQPLTELITCDKNDLAIEHIGTNYKVTLPIGTEIRFTVDTWSMFISSISIKPSIYDINEARGLCGVPSNTQDPSDDFTHRSDGPINDDQKFGDSWRISSDMKNEQLFIAEPEFLHDGYIIPVDDTKPNDNSTRYCVCEQEAGPTSSFEDFNSVQCNLTESTEYCSVPSQQTETTISAFYQTCIRSNRKKRSVKSPFHSIVRRSTIDSDDNMNFIPVTFSNDVDRNDNNVTATFKNDWTEEKAYQTCRQSIQNALPSSIYNDFVVLKEEDFIASCVIDIKLVGDLTFLSNTIGAMVTNIMMEVVKNESLYSLVTASGSQTLIEYITSFLCPNNCSDHGNCTAGVCECYEGYAGDDCSQKLSTPPSNISLPTNGICTLGNRACVRTNIYGTFPSKNVWYKLKHFQIIGNSTIYTSALDNDVLQADYRNVFMISVNLRSSRRRRSTSQTIMAEGYKISLSNDRSNFGDPVSIIIYDESCYTCDPPSFSCSLLDSCPALTTKTENPKDNKTSIAIGVSVALALVATFTIIGILYNKNKKSNKKINVTQPEQSYEIPESNEIAFGSDIWKKQENAIGEVDFDITNGRPETPVDLFTVVPPKSHCASNLNIKFNPSALSNRVSN